MLVTVIQEQYRDSFALNVTAVFFLTQKLLPQLGAGASVINMSSYFAGKMIPKRPSSLYSLSKGALNSLTKSLAFELGPRGIRVNAIAPGTIDTSMRRRSVDNLPDEAKAELKAYVERSYPLGRIGQAADIAGMAVHLASDESAWTSGAILAVDGGYTARLSLHGLPGRAVSRCCVFPRGWMRWRRALQTSSRQRRPAAGCDSRSPH